MHRFFVTPSQIHEGYIHIEGGDVKHISVLRLQPGDEVSICDGEGMDYLCRIRSFEREQVIAQVVDKAPSRVESPIQVTLYQGLPKVDKMDLVIQKATEIGVVRIVPISTARTVVELNSSKEQKRLERWQRIAESAAKQSGRARIPEVANVLDFSDGLAEAAPPSTDAGSSQTLALIPYEKETARSIRSVLSSHRQTGTRHVSVFIGPEGGFSEAEVEKAQSHGVTPVTLGPRILRTETAGLVVLAQIFYELEMDL